MTRPLLRLTRGILIPTALLSVAACLALEDALAPPEERLYGTRSSVRSMLRTALGLDRVATGGAPA